MDKEDILIRLNNLTISTSDVVLEWDKLYEWMLFIQKTDLEETKRLRQDLRTFVSGRLGVDIEGEGYVKWLDTEIARTTPDSPLFMAWVLQCFSLWKAYEYRQSQKDPDK